MTILGVHAGPDVSEHVGLFCMFLFRTRPPGHLQSFLSIRYPLPPAVFNTYVHKLDLHYFPTNRWLKSFSPRPMGYNELFFKNDADVLQEVRFEISE